MRQATSLATAAVSVFSALLIGGHYSPAPNHPRTAAWYAALDKPDFTPPGPAFAIAWTLLGSLMTYSGARLMQAKPTPNRTRALTLWSGTVASFALWPAIFFGRKNLPASIIAATTMTALAAASTTATSRIDRKAAAASIPTIAWLAFASILNGEIWRENRQ